MFASIEAAEWIRGRPRAALHELGSSGIGRVRPDPPPVPETIANRPPPPAGVTVHTLLASAYDVHPDRVLVTTGERTAAFLASAAALSAHEGFASGKQPSTVAVESPSAETPRRRPDALGAEIQRFRRSDVERGDVVSGLDDVIAADPALVEASVPHDPTGATPDRSTVESWASVARSGSAPLVIREGIDVGVQLAGIDGVAVVGSIGRYPGLAPVGIGWLVADRPFIDRAKSAAEYVSDPGGPALALAGRALYHADELRGIRAEWIAENADRLREFLEQRSPLSGRVVDGAHVAAVGHDRLDGTELANVAWEAGVLVVPGRFFELPDTVRVSLGRAPEDFAAALDAWAAALAAHT